MARKKRKSSARFEAQMLRLLTLRGVKPVRLPERMPLPVFNTHPTMNLAKHDVDSKTVRVVDRLGSTLFSITITSMHALEIRTHHHAIEVRPLTSNNIEVAEVLCD